MTSWFSKGKRGGRIGRGSHSKPRPRRLGYRPALEVLENRLAPATLTVNSFADDTQADPFLTLRESLLLVDNGGNANTALGRDLTAGEAAQITGTFGSNDTIQFDPALDGQTIALGSALPQLTANLALTGPGASQLAVSGNNTVEVLSIAAGVTAQLSGLLVENGHATYGGGIFNAGTLTLTDSIVSGNTSGSGGGVYNNGTLTMTNSTLSGNGSGNSGGGISNDGVLMLTDSTLSGNSAFNGAGIFNFSGTITVRNCTLSGNSSTRTGGGIYNLFGTMTVSDCTLSGNFAGTFYFPYYSGYGGGISNHGTMTLTNSTVSGNGVSNGLIGHYYYYRGGAGAGGGIDNSGNMTVTNSIVSGNAITSIPFFPGYGAGGGIDNIGSMTVTNSTLSGNSAFIGGGIGSGGTMTVTDSTLSGNSASSGGGIYNTGTLTASNSIVAGNGASFGADVLGTVLANSSLIQSTDQTTFAAGSGNNITGQDPLLGPLQDNGGPTQTMALLPGSPAIDAGDNSLAVDASGNPLTTDQRGQPFVRIYGARVDMGAYEVQPVSVTVGLSASPNPSDFGQALTFTATVLSSVPALGTPTGSVDFFDATTATDLGSVSLSSGSASLTTARLPVGNQTITVSYSGDANFLAGSGTVTVTIVPSIYVLDPTQGAALGLTGSASINIPGLVQVDSSSSRALAAGGSAQVQAGNIQVVGGFLTQDQATFSPAPVTGVASVTDPLAGLPAPAPSVGQPSVNLTAGSLTINPGMYIQIQGSGTGSLTLNPGVYIVGGGGFTVTQSASVSGTGVLIYNAGSNFFGSGTSLGGITLTGQGGINLTPASTGQYAGIVIFQSPDNPRDIALSAQAELGLANSIIYAPAALLSVSGNALIQNAFIVDRLLLGVNQASPQSPDDSTNASQALLVASATSWSPGSSGVAPSFGEIAAAQTRWDNAVGKVLSAAQPAGVSEDLARFSTVSPKPAHHSRLIEELFAQSGPRRPVYRRTAAWFKRSSDWVRGL